MSDVFDRFDFDAIWRRMKEIEIGNRKFEEGDRCPSCSQCDLEYLRPDICCCAAINRPPCWSCENMYLGCDFCGYESK